MRARVTNPNGPRVSVANSDRSRSSQTVFRQIWRRRGETKPVAWWKHAQHSLIIPPGYVTDNMIYSAGCEACYQQACAGRSQDESCACLDECDNEESQGCMLCWAQFCQANAGNPVINDHCQCYQSCNGEPICVQRCFCARGHSDEEECRFFIASGRSYLEMMFSDKRRKRDATPHSNEDSEEYRL